MAAMAALGDEGPFRTAAVSEAYGAKSTTATSLQRDGLIKKGPVVVVRRGEEHAESYWDAGALPH